MCPSAWVEPPTIPSNLVRVIENATLSDFALLTSAMHMAWMRQICGLAQERLAAIPSTSIYNTCGVDARRCRDFSKLDPLTQAVLDARVWPIRAQRGRFCTIPS